MKNAVFISYASQDVSYANKIYLGLKCCGISAWYAPVSIEEGADFSQEIGNMLQGVDQPENLDKVEQLGQSEVFIFLLSRNSMQSVWCPKELKMAINSKKIIHVLQLDHVELTPTFDFMLTDIQITSAYHLSDKVIRELFDNIKAEVKPDSENIQEYEKQYIYCHNIHMMQIAHGDPCFIDGETLFTRLTKLEYYLAPPMYQLTEQEREWVIDSGAFVKEDCILDTSLQAIQEEIGISDLIERIEYSRLKVIRDFIEQKNGCYFNNKKYGINGINPFARTENLSELPELKIEFYTTDYYTHRVMKDVCKQLFREQHSFFVRNLSFDQIHPFRILLTSMGINLLLLDTEKGIGKNVLLTRRSTNSSETYGKVRYSMSVIEGVSLSDYDPYRQNVSLGTAIERGLQEELGVMPEMLKRDSMLFSDLFVNLENLEIGVSCTVQLKENLSIEKNILKMHGKDETLEVMDKFPCQVEGLHKFLWDNQERFLNQAVYAIGNYLEYLGVPILVYNHRTTNYEESFVMGKQGEILCGDAIYSGEHFLAVVDGATPKGELLWDDLPGDVFIAQYLKDKISELPSEINAIEAVNRLNEALQQCYKEQNRVDLSPEERLQASILIFSKARREIWNFGDCQYAINGAIYNERKKSDILFAQIRSFFLETELLLGKTESELMEADSGREFILPLLKRQTMLANTCLPYGYPVLNGTQIQDKQIRVIPVKRGDHVVFASDGYPELCDTLAESEEILERILKQDPLCRNINIETKGIGSGKVSYDDRCYLSFVVK